MINILDRLNTIKNSPEICMSLHSLSRDDNSILSNQGTYRSLVYPFIYLETENGKAPTSVLLFYCFETVKGLDT